MCGRLLFFTLLTQSALRIPSLPLRIPCFSPRSGLHYEDGKQIQKLHNPPCRIDHRQKGSLQGPRQPWTIIDGSAQPFPRFSASHFHPYPVAGRSGRRTNPPAISSYPLPRHLQGPWNGVRRKITQVNQLSNERPNETAK
ncbi:uncharacterized protein BDZ83DRAFT_58263 [Colletotrichum acutatum]|uniref:Secreted protein n=1 Tax=Glomerella acutata TaxID=27357 RepID=A0AAD8UE99_GLOAC|nr:uncharacterized protein BDZ83DRAFT_58263 [Colletotrichum acutatum]KAK1715067.1 hypothetical protein BDZ83DRAFT_58263 [Colletotrichum acutatum]